MSTTETIITVNCQNLSDIRRFASVQAARSIGNGYAIFHNVADLAASQAVSTAALVSIYNGFNADKPVKRFADRNTASQRVWDTIVSHVEVEKGLNMTQVNEAVNSAANATETKEQKAARVAAEKAAAKAKKAEEKAAKDAKKKADAEAKKAAGGDKTRKSKFTGKLLVHTVAKDADGNVKNPRRAGSFGWVSLKIILDAGENGITLEDYQKAGGRMNDLHWDVDHGNVKAIDPPQAAPQA